MDIVLLILIIVFRTSKELHNYTAITTLSIIGMVIMFILNYMPYWWVSEIIYTIVLILSLTAKNNK